MKILENEGFTTEVKGEDEKLNKAESKDIKQNIKDIQANLLDRYITDTNKQKDEYNKIHERALF